jgi:hypothetical protein
MLAFGPYLPLAAGTYEASLVYESVGEAALVGRWEIVLGGYRQIRTVAAAGELAATAPNGGTLRRKFVVPARGANVFQFRVQYPGYGQLRVQQLTLTPVAIPALESRRTRRW